MVKLRWEMVLDTNGPITQHFAVGVGKYRGLNFKDNHNVIVRYYSDGLNTAPGKGDYLCR